MSYQIEARNIVSEHNSSDVLRGISLVVSPMESVGVVCSSRREKNHLGRILSCNMRPENGELFVNGCNTKKHNTKLKIGFVSLHFGLDEEFCLEDNLYLYASYFNMEKPTIERQVNLLARQFGLDSELHKMPSKLSNENRLKALIVRALIPPISVLIIDEPTELMSDPFRKMIIRLLKNKNDNIAIIYLSMKVSSLDVLCDRVAILNKGKVICIDSPETLIEEHVGRQVAVYSFIDRDLDYHINKIKDQYRYQIINNKIRVYFKKSKDLEETLSFLPGDNVMLRQSNLSDVFVHLTGREVESAV